MPAGDAGEEVVTVSRSAVGRLGVARAQLELARALSSSGGNVAGRAQLAERERKLEQLEVELADELAEGAARNGGYVR